MPEDAVLTELATHHHTDGCWCHLHTQAMVRELLAYRAALSEASVEVMARVIHQAWIDYWEESGGSTCAFEDRRYRLVRLAEARDVLSALRASVPAPHA